MKPWLAVIGVGEDGEEGLSAAARALIADARLVVGGARHLALAPAGGAERQSWSHPIETTLAEIARRRGEPVCVLASGDPMCHGIGATLARRFAAEEMTVIPAPSALSLACARLGWALHETETISLVGRPVAQINLHLAPAARLLVLSENGDSPAAVAALLAEAGYGPSRMSAFEHLGGPAERRIDAAAADWHTGLDIADLNMIAIECRAGADAKRRSRLAGLPDDAFENDGQLTKREIRAATLALLAPRPGERLWDIGAGSGSIAIEWRRGQGQRGSAIAIEPAAERRRRIAANAMRLGVPDIEIVAGEAPMALDGLAAPDAIFVGGGVARPGMIETCWAALNTGGRLVANVITTEGEARLIAFQASEGGSLTRIGVERIARRGGFNAWRPLTTVTQFCAVKP